MLPFGVCSSVLCAIYSSDKGGMCFYGITLKYQILLPIHKIEVVFCFFFNHIPCWLVIKFYRLFQLNIGDWLECGLVFKVYQSMLRVIKDSENVDERQHCFLIQTSGQESRYFSVETRQELLRIESAWHCSVCAAVMKLGVCCYFIKYTTALACFYCI